MIIRARQLLRLLLALIFGLSSVGETLGQSFTVLHDFSELSGPNITNTDGASPYGGLASVGGLIFGTTKYGGYGGMGTVYKLDPAGNGFTAIHHFEGIGGANPVSELLPNGSLLFGTASIGGNFGNGTVFAIDTNGSNLNVLHHFTLPVNNGFGSRTNSDGAKPLAGLIGAGNTLFGSANEGGTSGHGTLFSIDATNTQFFNIHNLVSGSGGTFSIGGLVLDGDTLYGTSFSSLGRGSVFAVITNGNSFTNYYAFTSGQLNNFGILTNSDGANPYCRLVRSGDRFYGTTQNGGSFGNGTVFSMNGDGTGFTILHSFSASAYNQSGIMTNRDGANPSSGLVKAGDWLYGDCAGGGPNGNGSIYAVKVDSSGFINLYNFSATPPYPQPQINIGGANPFAGLILVGTTFYGSAPNGGGTGNGTIFALSLAPSLRIKTIGTNIVVSWPDSLAGFDYSSYTLQSASTPFGPFTDLPNAVSPFTNSVVNSDQFFRLYKAGQ